MEGSSAAVGSAKGGRRPIRTAPWLVGAVQFRADQGEHIRCGILSEEDVEMPVVGNHVQRMITFAPGIKEVKSALLAFGEKTVVIQAREKGEPGRGGGLFGDEVGRQFRMSIDSHEVPGFDAGCHLFEERNRHLREFLPL